jgi:hypothetical protein
VSDFSFANPQRGAWPEGSFADLDTIELGAGIQEGFSLVAHPDIVP